MGSFSRRNFLQRMRALLALPFLRSEEPELILYNGNIWTADENQSQAQAVAISDGRFVAVGSNEDVLRLATVRTRKLDLGFKTVLPGFNDAHSHPAEAGVEHLRKVACDKESIEQIKAVLYERAKNTRPGEWVRIGGVKQYADGSISERTAWLSQPYIGIPNNYVGLQLSSAEQLYETGRKAHAAGWQLATHANGDLAIDRILSVYERIQKELPKKDPRFRIEHCTMATEPLIQRMHALQVIPAPFSCYVYFHGDIMHFYGQERTKHMFPMRSFLDAGMRPTDSSDYTASPADAMMWLYSQLTRTDMKGNVWGRNQRITLEEAIRCGTVNGAYAAFEEHLKGRICPVQLADLVVLAQDPFKTNPSDLLKIKVERTMVGGIWRFES
jgi:predicted amidohydrolase YtcJ